MVSTTPRSLYSRERPCTHCTGGWVGPRAGLDGCAKSRLPNGIRSPDRPARCESLYRLSYPGPYKYECLCYKLTVVLKVPKYCYHFGCFPQLGSLVFRNYPLISYSTLSTVISAGGFKWWWNEISEVGRMNLVVHCFLAHIIRRVMSLSLNWYR